jgi:hypothetical protein
MSKMIVVFEIRAARRCPDVVRIAGNVRPGVRTFRGRAGAWVTVLTGSLGYRFRLPVSTHLGGGAVDFSRFRINDLAEDGSP